MHAIHTCIVYCTVMLFWTKLVKKVKNKSKCFDFVDFKKKSQFLSILCFKKTLSLKIILFQQKWYQNKAGDVYDTLVPVLSETNKNKAL